MERMTVPCWRSGSVKGVERRCIVGGGWKLNGRGFGGVFGHPVRGEGAIAISVSDKPHSGKCFFPFRHRFSIIEILR